MANFRANSISDLDGRQKTIIVALLGLVVVALAFPMSAVLPAGVDWHLAFRPAAQEILRGHSPYNISGFFNPPWTLIPLMPLALLPESLGRAFFLLMNLMIFVYVAYRLGASATTMLFFLLSPPVLHSLLNGNIDAFVVLGFVLPPPVGLFFLSIKPQIGAGVALFWFVEAWRTGKLSGVLKTFAPVTIAWLASFLLYGWWIGGWGQEVDLWWNASMWPLSIPLGLVLLVASIRKRRKEFAMAAAPCLSPYVLLHAWVGALASLMTLPAEMIAAVLGLWIIVVSSLLGF